MTSQHPTGNNEIPIRVLIDDGESMGQVRGSFIYNLRKYIMKNFPREFYQDFLSRLDQEARKILEGMIISSRMYSLDVYHQTQDLFHKMAGEEHLVYYSRAQAESNLKGVFGLIARLISIETLINRMNKMWKTAFNQGRASLVDREGDNGTLRISEFRFTDSHRIATGAYLSRIIELADKCKVSYECKIIDPQTTDYVFTMTKD